MKILFLAIVLLIPKMVTAQIEIKGKGTASYNSSHIELKLIPEKPDHIICNFYYHDMKYSSLEFKVEISMINARKFKTYIKDKKLIGDGFYTTYYSSGIIRKIEIFKNNINTGYIKTFYQNGTTESEYIPKDNEIFESISYDKYGEKQQSIETDKSGKQKKYTYFYENGFPKEEINYLNDTLNGYVKLYNQDRTLARNEIFKNSISVSTQCFPDDGFNCPPLIDTLKVKYPNFPKLSGMEAFSKDSFVFITFNTKENNGDIDYHGPEPLKNEILGWFKAIRWEKEILNGHINNSQVVIAYNLAQPPKFKLYRNFKPDIFESNYTLTNSTVDNVFKKGLKLPEFPGGINGLIKYLSSSIRYPSVATEMGHQGKVIVAFTVCTDGTMCNYKIVRGVSDELDNEAIRVVSQIPRWIPGSQFGKPVSVWFTLPIIFSLNN